MRPLIRAEQALLGAVLLDPEQLSRMSSWLRPDDFQRPLHGVLYTAMLRLHPGHPGAAADAAPDVRLAWVTDTVTAASKNAHGLNAAYAHALIAACPHPGNAPAYGRMVLDGAIHQSVAEHATRLHQAARADTVRGSIRDTLDQTDILTGVLVDLDDRWHTPRDVPAPPRAPHVSSSAPPRIPVPEEQLVDEEALLASLTRHPELLPRLTGWLLSEDFTSPGHRQLYRCLTALHHRGEPIDAMTVLWEAQRSGALADGALNSDQVLRICAHPVAGTPGWLGEQILHRSVLRTAAACAGHVQDAADDAALAPVGLITTARTALAPLRAVRHRWHTATTPALQGRAEPSPAREPAPGRPSPARTEAARFRSRRHPAIRPAARAPIAPKPSRDSSDRVTRRSRP